MSIPNYMLRPIHTVADAHAFVRALNDDGAFFHLEDDPSDVVCSYGGQPLFTAEECDALWQRQCEIYALTSDPCQLASDALGDGASEDFDEDDDRQILTRA